MEVSIQTDKKSKNRNSFNSKPIEEESQLEEQNAAQLAKQRKIKRLTLINRELIEKLKEQNEQLTKRISKQKLKPTLRSSSVRNSGQTKSKETESTKRQLMNAYKQIDMYKSVLTNLKAKEISIQSLDKINQLENKVKYEENVIEDLQKQIKYLTNIKNKQEKELRIYENEDVKQSLSDLQKQAKMLKQKLKQLKKIQQKRQDSDKKQQAYQIELERALRKMNDEYYPGKIEKKEGGNEDEYHDISERQWQTVKTQLAELKKNHEENGKKIQQLNRQKNRELKSAEENDLKLKQRTRKLQTLKSKLEQLTKLVKVRESTHEKKNLHSSSIFGQNGQKIQNMNAQKDGSHGRQIKKWVIPHGYCLEQGKILPNSIFFSDKTMLAQAKKSKIIEVTVWVDHDDIPNVLQFFYEDDSKQKIEGIQPLPTINSDLQAHVFRMKGGDYLHKVRGKFYKGEIVSLHLVSKLGKQMKFQGQLGKKEGEPFGFEPRPNEVPSLVFGAYSRKNDRTRLCHLGIQFISDW